MTVRTVIGAALILAGVAVALVAVLGLFRFRDVLERLNAGALADTLGVLLALAGLAVLCGWTAHTAKLVLVLAILWATNPVSAHLIARMELFTGRDLDPEHMETGEREL